MDEEIILSRFERGGSAYAEVLLNRPAKGNALTLPMVNRLAEVVQSLRADRGVRAVVLRGAGRFFCTGGDVKAWGALSPQAMATDWILRGIEVLQALADLPQPVIAVISGPVYGGGLELALAADLRLATPAARFAVPEVTLGMVAGWGGVRRLAETIGPARARHLALLGSAITAEQALDWGLVTALAESPEALEDALGVWLDRILANGPVAMALTKSLLGGVHHDARQAHAAAVAEAKASEDCAEGVRAFAEKRSPIFPNR